MNGTCRMLPILRPCCRRDVGSRMNSSNVSAAASKQEENALQALGEGGSSQTLTIEPFQQETHSRAWGRVGTFRDPSRPWEHKCLGGGGPRGCGWWWWGLSVGGARCSIAGLFVCWAAPGDPLVRTAAVT